MFGSQPQCERKSETAWHGASADTQQQHNLYNHKSKWSSASLCIKCVSGICPSPVSTHTHMTSLPIRVIAFHIVSILFTLFSSTFHYLTIFLCLPTGPPRAGLMLSLSLCSQHSTQQMFVDLTQSSF